MVLVLAFNLRADGTFTIYYVVVWAPCGDLIGRPTSGDEWSLVCIVFYGIFFQRRGFRRCNYVRDGQVLIVILNTNDTVPLIPVGILFLASYTRPSLSLYRNTKVGEHACGVRATLAVH